MIESTFQLGAGLGPARERKLWREGLARWDDVVATSRSIASPSYDRKLRTAVDLAQVAYSAGGVAALARLVPVREHWRFFGAFSDEAVYLDIETSDDVVGFAGISAIGILDRDGPKLLLAGRDLERFPEIAADWKMLVTFNGSSFDVPVLRAAFPDWEPPACHIDLRHVLARLGHEGGLKAIERRLAMLHLRRPAHLDGIDGWNACTLYRRGRDGDREAMRRFAEYNLYDAINLRTLMAYAYNERVELETGDVRAMREQVRRVAVPGRGDVLYDVSKLLVEIE